jgi:hypothetical protein
MHRGEIYMVYLIDIRSLPKGRSPLSFLLSFFTHKLFLDCSRPAQRGWEHTTMPALPFVRSMGPNTRNVVYHAQGGIAIPHP